MSLSLSRLPRTLGAAATVASIALLVPATAGAASAPSGPLLASLQYLAAQQSANGAIATGYGAGADISTTEDTVIGLADAGYDPATLRNPAGSSGLDFLVTNRVAETDTAKHTAKLILAVVAAHGDPGSFASTDLVAKLGGFYNSTTGQFDATPDVFSQSFGILATAAAGRTIPAKALTTLAAMQCGDGGFACPGGKGSSDTNSTAVALMALHCAGAPSAHCAPVTTADPTALVYLHGVQDTDGGFPFNAGSGSDPDSDALIIEGLIAAGQDPGGVLWAKGGLTPEANLRSFQATSGGFTFPGNPAPDAFTTGEPPAALAHRPYGAPTSFSAGAALPAASAAPSSPSAAPPPGAVAGVRVAVGLPATGGGGILPTPSGASGTELGAVAVLELVGVGALVLAGVAVCLVSRRPHRTQPR